MATPLESGTVLQERYRLVREASQKTGYTLYLADDLVEGGVVALKTLAKTVTKDREVMDQIIGTVELLRGQRCPGLVNVHDFFYERQAAFLAESWVEGAPLLKLLRNRRPKIAEVMILMAPLAKGLDYLIEREMPAQNFSATDLVVAAPESEGDGWLMTPIENTGVFELKIDPVPLGRGRRATQTGQNLYVGSFVSLLYQMLGGQPAIGSRQPTYTPLPGLQEEGNVILRRYVTRVESPRTCQALLLEIAASEAVAADLIESLGLATERSAEDRHEEIGETEAAIGSRIAKIEELKESLQRKEKAQELAALQRQLEENLQTLEAERRAFRQQVADEKKRLEGESQRLREENDQLEAERGRQGQLNTRLASLQEDFDTEKARMERELERRYAERNKKFKALQATLSRLEDREQELTVQRQRAADDERELHRKLLELSEREATLQREIEGLRQRTDTETCEIQLSELEQALVGIRLESASQERRKQAVSEELAEFQAQVCAVREEREQAIAQAQELSLALTGLERAREDLDVNLKVEFEQRERMLERQLRAAEAKSVGTQERMEELTRREGEARQREERAQKIEEELKGALSVAQQELVQVTEGKESAEKELGEALIDLGVDRQGAKRRRRKRLVAAVLIMIIGGVVAYKFAPGLIDRALPGQIEFSQLAATLSDRVERGDWPAVISGVRQFEREFRRPDWSQVYEKQRGAMVEARLEAVRSMLDVIVQDRKMASVEDVETLGNDLYELNESVGLSSEGQLLWGLVGMSYWVGEENAEQGLKSFLAALDAQQLESEKINLGTIIFREWRDALKLVKAGVTEPNLSLADSLEVLRKIRDHAVFQDQFAVSDREVRSLVLELEVRAMLGDTAEDQDPTERYRLILQGISDELALGIVEEESVKAIAVPIWGPMEKAISGRLDPHVSELFVQLGAFGSKLELASPFLIQARWIERWNKDQLDAAVEKRQPFRANKQALHEAYTLADKFGDPTGRAHAGDLILSAGRAARLRAPEQAKRFIKIGWDKLIQSGGQGDPDGMYYACRNFFEARYLNATDEEDVMISMREASTFADQLAKVDRPRGRFVIGLLGWIHAKQEDTSLENCLPDLELASKSWPEANYYLASLLEELGRSVERVRALKQGTTMNDPDCLYSYGDMLYQGEEAKVPALEMILDAALRQSAVAVSFLVKEADKRHPTDVSDWFQRHRDLIGQLSGR